MNAWALTMASIKSIFDCLARWTARPRYQAWERVLGTEYFLITSPRSGLAAAAVEFPNSMHVCRVMDSTRLVDSAACDRKASEDFGKEAMMDERHNLL